MQKTGWWIGGAALAVLAVIAVVVAGSGGDSGEGGGGAAPERAAGDERPEILRPAARVRAAGETGPAEPGPGATPASVLAEAGRRTPTEDPDIARILRGADEDRSAGFLYGRTRRQVEILTERIGRYTENAERLRREGDETRAERQMQVVQRMTERLETVRTEQAEHRAAAQADGTLGEEQAGYEEAEPSREARPVRIRPPAE